MKRTSVQLLSQGVDQSCLSCSWGCLAACGAGNISRVEGKMDSVKFQHVLNANLMPSVKKLKLNRGWLLQMDNDPKHTWKSIVDYITRRKLKVLRWSHNVLNTIESVSVDLGRAVRDRQPRNLKELEDFCEEAWAKMLQTGIERLLAGDKKHLQAVMLAKGGSIRSQLCRVTKELENFPSFHGFFLHINTNFYLGYPKLCVCVCMCVLCLYLISCSYVA